MLIPRLNVIDHTSTRVSQRPNQPCQWALDDALTSIQPFLFFIPSASISCGGFIRLLRRHVRLTRSATRREAADSNVYRKLPRAELLRGCSLRRARKRVYSEYKFTLKFISKLRLHVNPEEDLPAMSKFDNLDKSQRPLLSQSSSLFNCGIWIGSNYGDRASHANTHQALSEVVKNRKYILEVHLDFI